MLEGDLPGHVFAQFDRQDSGNISYGVRSGDARCFVKTAGIAGSAAVLDRDQRIQLLRNAIEIARSCAHRLLVPLRRVIESPGGPLLVYDWFDGELVGVAPDQRADPTSSFQRFRALPTLEHELAAIFDLHVALAAEGWIANDFYDGCLMYEFAASELRVIDLDGYHRGPFRNEMGRLFGSTRFMAPEEFERGAMIDERTSVFTMGRAAFVFLGEADAFRGTAAQLAAALTACQPDPSKRFPSLRAFRDAWG
jgi:serine/threonine protein kinase, bacterial